MGMKIAAAAAGTFCMCGIALHNVQAQDAKQYTLNDAYEVLQCALHVPDAEAAAWHDVNDDGDVTLEDAKLCLQYALKIKSPGGTDMPNPQPTQPGGDVAASQTPTPSDAPTPTAQPGETTKPTDTPEAPGTTSAPYISTDHVMLYTGNNATGNDYASVTVHNVTDPANISFYFSPFEDNKVWLREGKDSSDWLYINDVLTVVPTVDGHSVTYSIRLSDNMYESGWDDLISGASAIYFYPDPDDDDTYFKVDITIERNHTDTTYYRIMDEYSINVGMVSEDATFSDPSMCTTDAAVIIDGMNRHYGTHIKWTVPQDGTMHVTGPCVITELEVNTERHYTVNHEKRVEEIYLETKGEYDEEMTRAVEAELKKDGGWFTGDEANCPHPKAYIDFVYNTVDSWYKGEISYRCMVDTLRYTKFYEENKHYNSGAVAEGARPEYFPISDTNGTISGQGQNCHIFTIKGTIDVGTVWQAMEDQSYGMGLNTANTGYVRVHYDSEYDISYIYYIG